MTRQTTPVFFSVLLSAVLYAPAVVWAQQAPAASADNAALDPRIEKLLASVSEERLQQLLQKLVSFGTRNTLSDTASTTRGIGAARQWIYDELKRTSPRLQVSFDTYQIPAHGRITRDVELRNVMAILPGKSPRRIYVSGHYDSLNLGRAGQLAGNQGVRGEGGQQRPGAQPQAPGETGAPAQRPVDPQMRPGQDYNVDAPGANDDGSGTVLSMELARVFAQSGIDFDATLVFMTVAGEEQGLLGAKHYADEAKKNGWNIAGMFDNDIIGSSHADDGRKDDTQVRLFAQGVPPTKEMSDANRTLVTTGGENDSLSRQLARHVKDTGERYVKGFKVNVIYRLDRYLRGGDHSPFVQNGYAAVRFTEPNENFDHQHQDLRTENGKVYGDLPEFDDFNYIAKVTKVNAASLASLALAPGVPQKVAVRTDKLENDTTLVWEPNKEPDLAGYRIVWRETTAPFWQGSKFVGNVTEASIKLSKDNYFFGVQAVDKDGNVSPATYPLPKR